MAENAKDIARSVLVTAINDTDTSIVIDGTTYDETRFSATGDYSVALRDPITSEVELVRISSRTSATLTASARGSGDPATTARAWPVGTIVECVLDMESLIATITDNAGGGGGGASVVAYASLPAAGSAGLSYNFTDSIYTAIDNGASYDMLVGSKRVVLPPGSGWTDLNIGSVALVTNKGFRSAVEAASSAGQIKGQYRALPSAPYDLKVALMMPAVNGAIGGVGLYSSGDGKLTYLYPSNNSALTYQTWNSVSSVSGNYLNAVAGCYPTQPLWVRFVDDNTNRMLYISVDGVTWAKVHSVSRTDFHTPDSFFYAVASFSGTVDSAVTLVSYDV